MPPRLPVLTPLLAAAAVAIHLLPPAVAAALQFDRAAVEAGQAWRLVTAHFTHCDANHLAWDVGVFFALGWTCERLDRRTTTLALGAAAVAITLGVWAWQPQFATYRGLSGLDCTLFALLASTLLRSPARVARWCGGVALLALGAKCSFETATATTLFASGAGYDPVPLAHLLGAAAGAWPPWLKRTRSVAIPVRVRPFSPPCPNSIPSLPRSPAARTISSREHRTGPTRGPASRRPSRSTIPPSNPPIGARSWRG
ncbi:MAG: rhombosortase [Opitutaceae bacterium]|nr:rhombosortase [Opitutaceae bacterium]